jgi:AcrR family transcriptional regulator
MVTMTDRLPLKERKRHQTSARIVEAAVALFTEHGFDATTADDIADAAECSRSTLFRYFGTKEDILFGEVYVMLAEVREELGRAHPCADPWQTAKDVGVTRFVEYMTGEGAIPRACVALWLSHPALQSRYLDINHRWEGVLAEFFAVERGVDPSTDLDSQVRASVAVAAVRSVLMAYAVPGTDVPTAVAQAFALVEGGMGH